MKITIESTSERRTGRRPITADQKTIARADFGIILNAIELPDVIRSPPPRNASPDGRDERLE